jgi:hypothetical protein
LGLTAIIFFAKEKATVSRYVKSREEPLADTHRVSFLERVFNHTLFSYDEVFRGKNIYSAHAERFKRVCGRSDDWFAS